MADVTVLQKSTHMNIGIQDKSRSVCEKKRRNETNTILSEIETLLFTSKPCEFSSRKVGKIQILEKTCSFIRFYKKLVDRLENFEITDSTIPSKLLYDIFIYSQRGFVFVVDTNGQVICCSSSTMGFLESRDTEIVGSKLSLILTSNDSDHIISLINEKKTENHPFLLHFTINSPDSLRTFICRAFWHQFPSSEGLSEAEEDDEGSGALILSCSSIDKLSMYNLPIFYSDNAISFEFKVSLDVKFTKIDEAMTKYTGYTSAELIGCCLFDYINWEQILELMETIKASLQNGVDSTGRLQLCCKSKSWIWIQAKIIVSQNIWNARIDSLIFMCKALDYNDVISFFAQNSQPCSSHPPHAMIQDMPPGPITSQDMPHGPITSQDNSPGPITSQDNSPGPTADS